MDKRPADMFYEYLEGPGIWVDDLEEFEREKAFLEGVCIHNYMLHVPTESFVKYPACFVIKKRKETSECTILKKSGYRHPTFSSMFMDDFVRLPDSEQGEFEKLVVVFDTELFDDVGEAFKTALWAFKFHDNIVELYDGIHIAKEFIEFVKPSYEAGLLTVGEGEEDE